MAFRRIARGVDGRIQVDAVTHGDAVFRFAVVCFDPRPIGVRLCNRTDMPQAQQPEKEQYGFLHRR